MKPFLQGKKTLAVEPLRAQLPSDKPASRRSGGGHGHHHGAGHGAHGAGAAGNAHVDVVKEGDKVVRLIVTCACGERVEIECLYSAGH